MKVRYSTNWMGPVYRQWYTDRGLDPDKDAWRAGRIDVNDGTSPYGPEIALPMMHEHSWVEFSHWLDTMETDDIWTLDQLVELYELKNPKIRWWRDEPKNS